MKVLMNALLVLATVGTLALVVIWIAVDYDTAERWSTAPVLTWAAYHLVRWIRRCMAKRTVQARVGEIDAFLQTVPREINEPPPNAPPWVYLHSESGDSREP